LPAIFTHPGAFSAASQRCVPPSTSMGRRRRELRMARRSIERAMVRMKSLSVPLVIALIQS
jgi:hypothetical protein